MPDKNMDNEQTIYISGDDAGTADSGVNQEKLFQTPQMPQNNVYRSQPGIPPQMPQNNVYGAQPGIPPQMPQNNAYGIRPGIPPQNNMYGMPAGYGDPRMRQAAAPGYGRKRKKGNTAIIVLIVTTVLLIFIIGGVAAFIVLNDNDDGGSRHKGVEGSSEHERVSDTDEDDEENDSSVYEETTQVTTEEKTETVTEPQTTTPVQKLITTPDVRSWDCNLAAANLKDLGFVVEIENQYSSEPAGVVISQNVAAGTSVAEGTKIVITVSQGENPAEKVIVPDVRGMSAEEAKNVMQKSGLIVNSEYKESDTVAAEKVIDQDIASGTKVEKGSYIFLTVSKGSSHQQSQYQRGKVTTKETELNVRKGPGKQYEITGTVGKDSIVEIVSLEGDWYKIVFGEGFGYVSKDYIQLMS